MVIGFPAFLERTRLLPLAALLAASCAPRPDATLATPREIGRRIAESQAPLTLVHAWATWCQPCREEFPELLAAFRQYRAAGLELVLVSADSPDDVAEVAAFLAQQRSPVGSLVSTELDQEFMQALSADWSGALPASFFFGAGGTPLAEWEGKRSREQFAETIETLLQQQPKGATP